MNLTRRALIAGFAGLLSAPVVIRTAGLLMPVKAWSHSPITMPANYGYKVGDRVRFSIATKCGWEGYDWVITAITNGRAHMMVVA